MSFRAKILGFFIALSLVGNTFSLVNGGRTIKQKDRTDTYLISQQKVNSQAGKKPEPAKNSLNPSPAAGSLPLITVTAALKKGELQQNSGRCLITLWNRQYDVTALQSSHSGGNIFTCGADMTSVYQKQHGTDLSRMVPYLINNGTSGGSPAVTGSPAINSGAAAGGGENHSEDDF